MSKPDRKLAALEGQLQRLARRLSRTGHVSQGTVFERKQSGGGSRYQWTWKDPRQKTVSVTLSKQQYNWLQRAIGQARAVEKTLAKMRQISRRMVLEHVPGPHRRKRLPLIILRAI